MSSSNRNPIFPETIRADAAQILPADTTTVKSLVTPSANGTNIRAISCVSDDTAAQKVTLSISKSAVTYKIGESNIAIGAGTNGAAKAVNLLNAVDATWLNQDGSMDLPSGAILQINTSAAVTAGKTLNFVAFGADY